MEAMVSTLERLWVSDRLVYKPFEETDENKDLIYRLSADPVTAGLGGLGVPKPPLRARAEKSLADSPNQSILSVMICLPREGDGPDHLSSGGNAESTPIGLIKLKSEIESSASIAIAILPAYQGKGYGRESINWIIDWTFQFTRLHRISISTLSFNERAIHLYRDIGFKEEGRRREVVYMRAQWFDMVDFSILEHEWEERKARNQ